MTSAKIAQVPCKQHCPRPQETTSTPTEAARCPFSIILHTLSKLMKLSLSSARPRSHLSPHKQVLDQQQLLATATRCTLTKKQDSRARIKTARIRSVQARETKPTSSKILLTSHRKDTSASCVLHDVQSLRVLPSAMGAICFHMQSEHAMAPTQKTRC